MNLKSKFGGSTKWSDLLAVGMIVAVGVVFFWRPLFAGEVKPKVVARATVPNRAEDYQLTLTSVPREEVVPGEEITYTILYGCSGWNETSSLSLGVVWAEGVGEYVAQSAGLAYGSAAPEINVEERSITWAVGSFPARTTSQRVSFKLLVPSAHEGSGTFPIEVAAHLVTPSVSKEAYSVLHVMYPGGRVPETPVVVWHYLRELLAHPALRFISERLVVLLLVVFMLLSPLVFLARFDIDVTFLPLLLLYSYYWCLELLGLRDKSPVWGNMLSEDARRPVFLAKITIFDFKGRRQATSFTNRRGEFGFRLPQGKYLLAVDKARFTLPIGKNRRGFFLTAVPREALLLSDRQFIWEWVGERGEFYLGRRSILGFWEEAFERVGLGLSDFVLMLGILLSLTNFYFHRSPISALLVFFYLFFFSVWTLSIW